MFEVLWEILYMKEEQRRQYKMADSQVNAALNTSGCVIIES
jgi:hypothetical protein